MKTNTVLFWQALASAFWVGQVLDYIAIAIAWHIYDDIHSVAPHDTWSTLIVFMLLSFVTSTTAYVRLVFWPMLIWMILHFAHTDPNAIVAFCTGRWMDVDFWINPLIVVAGLAILSATSIATVASQSDNATKLIGASAIIGFFIK